MKPRNFVAKHMRQFNKPSVVPNKRRQAPSSRSACLEGEIASEGSNTQGKEAIELMFDSGCGSGVEYTSETNELEE